MEIKKELLIEEYAQESLPREYQDKYITQFPDEQVRITAVKSIIKIEDEISKYVELTQGKSYLSGKCPFCGILTNCFKISVTQQSFYCFNCYKAGDVIDFISFKCTLSKSDALDKLELKILADPIKAYGIKDLSSEKLKDYQLQEKIMLYVDGLRKMKARRSNNEVD